MIFQPDRMNSDEVLPMRVKTLVVGVGNPILSDDGVGIHAARMLMGRGIPDVRIEELPASGLELLDMVLDHDRVIIIDAIQTRGGTPGDHYLMEEEDFRRTVHGSSPHGINIATALAMGRKVVPERMPKEVFFVAVEAEDLENVGERLTPRLAEKLPAIVDMIERDLIRRDG
jgi:hydrogenase maturation protease